MSIEKITSRITGEAEALKASVLAEAKAQADAVLAEAKAKADALVQREEARGLAEKEKLIERRRSVADIDSRKRLLEEKQTLISQCFDQTIDALLAMEEGPYVNLLVAMGKASGLTAGTLVFNEAEKASIGQKVADALGSGFTVSDKTANLRGGYLLLAGDVTINSTIEGLVGENRSSRSGEVAAMLFAEEA